MEIHKPRPVHTWRDLATEIAVIVIGISIALGADQVIEHFRLLRQIDDDKVILARELSHNLRGGIVRLRTSECTDARLNQLSIILDQADRSGVLPPVAEPGRPRSPAFDTGGWANVIASQSATHLPRDQLQALQFVYNIMGKADRLTDDEISIWTTIYTMVGPGRRLGPGEAQGLRVALAQARTINIEIATLSVRLVQQLKTLDLDFDAEERAQIRGLLTMPISALDTRGICAAIGNIIPPNYGQSPWSQLMPLSAEGLKALQSEF